jgi:hypothetical protein
VSKTAPDELKSGRVEAPALDYNAAAATWWRGVKLTVEAKFETIIPYFSLNPDSAFEK